tara:strand:+ start:2583 stop:3692 length:1110 start_codon:yes stop_codon:yes gene_type:complete
VTKSDYENLLGLAALKSREDERDHLSALVDSGDLDQSRLRLLAYAGSLAAVSLLGVKEICWCRADRRKGLHVKACPLHRKSIRSQDNVLRVPKDVASWTQGLAIWGQQACVRGAVAAIDFLLQQQPPSRYPPGHKIHRWLVAIEGWLLCPCVRCQSVIPSLAWATNDPMSLAVEQAGSAASVREIQVEKRAGEAAQGCLDLLLGKAKGQEEALRLSMRRAISRWVVAQPDPVLEALLRRTAQQHERGTTIEAEDFDQQVRVKVYNTFARTEVEEATTLLLSASRELRESRGFGITAPVGFAVVHLSAGDLTLLKKGLKACKRTWRATLRKWHESGQVGPLEPSHGELSSLEEFDQVMLPKIQKARRGVR